MTVGGETIGEPKSLRKKDFGALVGVSPGRVTHMIKQGLPVEPDGRIDVARGKQWIRENVNPTRSAAQSKQGDLPFAAQLDAAAEHARLAKERADTQALKNAQLRKELVAAEDVEREWASMIRTARSALLAVPSRLRQIIPHLTAEEVEAIDGELRRVLKELADA
jgi:phage terminase Nu1 subunit (DNA packaging protein)